MRKFCRRPVATSPARRNDDFPVLSKPQYSFPFRIRQSASGKRFFFPHPRPCLPSASNWLSGMDWRVTLAGALSGALKMKESPEPCSSDNFRRRIFQTATMPRAPRIGDLFVFGWLTRIGLVRRKSFLHPLAIYLTATAANGAVLGFFCCSEILVVSIYHRRRPIGRRNK